MYVCIGHIQNLAIFTTLSIIVNSDTVTFASYLDRVSHFAACLEPLVTLACLKPCHIQNPGIFRTRDILITCQDTFWNILNAV